jgi:hypothetical protein
MLTEARSWGSLMLDQRSALGIAERQLKTKYTGPLFWKCCETRVQKLKLRSSGWGGNPNHLLCPALRADFLVSATIFFAAAAISFK